MRESRQAASLDPDTQLMLRFQKGDLQAFEALFDRHVRALVKFAYRFVRNRDVAEELAQDIFLRVHDAAGTYRPDAKFRTWLYKIATNVCLNELRRPRYRVRHESLDEEGPAGEPSLLEIADPRGAAPDKALQRKAVAGALEEALRDLPEGQRVAFTLTRYEDMSYAEAAAVMNTSEKAVKSLIHRAKEGLAERLRPLLAELL